MKIFKKIKQIIIKILRKIKIIKSRNAFENRTETNE